MVHMWKVSSAGQYFHFPSPSSEISLETGPFRLTLGDFRREERVEREGEGGRGEGEDKEE